MFEGIPARYDVFGGDEKKHALLDDPQYVSKERAQILFDILKAGGSEEDDNIPIS